MLNTKGCSKKELEPAVVWGLYVDFPNFLLFFCKLDMVKNFRIELCKGNASPLGTNAGLIYLVFVDDKFVHMQLSITIKDIIGSNSYVCSKT